MSYDCGHRPKCVNERHHVMRFYTEPRPVKKSYADAVVIVLAIAWCVVGVAMVLLGAGCNVYEEPEQCGRAHPGGGVTVRLSELADDGGEHE